MEDLRKRAVCITICEQPQKGPILLLSLLEMLIIVVLDINRSEVINLLENSVLEDHEYI